MLLQGLGKMQREIFENRRLACPGFAQQHGARMLARNLRQFNSLGWFLLGLNLFVFFLLNLFDCNCDRNINFIEAKRNARMCIHYTRRNYILIRADNKFQIRAFRGG